jgi:CTP-dependent riboflavin kinase
MGTKKRWFVMIDNTKLRHANLSGSEYDLLMFLLDHTKGLGLVDISQQAAAQEMGVSKQRMCKLFSNLRAKRVLIKCRSKRGNVDQINPEFCWNYSNDIRKGLVTDIRQARLERSIRQETA